MENLNSAQDAAVWARRILPAKNTLHEADARQVEEAFEVKLTAINGQSDSASVGDGHDVPQASLTNGDVPPARLAATGQTAEAIDKSELVHPEPRRIRDRDHLRFVSTQPCLSAAAHLPIPIICASRKAAHLRKVSDEFIVPLCRGHHREVHRFSDETAGGEKPALTRTLSREVCGYNLILRVRGSGKRYHTASAG